MIKVIKRNLTHYRRFFVLLAKYISQNTRLVVIYLLTLVVDSFAKAFSAVSIIPLVNFLAGDSVASNQKIMLFFKEALSVLNLDYTLSSSIMILMFGTLIAAITEVFFYSIGRRNAYKILYFFISIGMKRFFSNGLKFINSNSFGVIQNTFQREVQQIAGGVSGILIMVSSIFQISFLLVVAFSLSTSMTTMTIVIMTIVFLLMSNLNLTLSRLSAKTTKSGNELSHALFEPLLNAKQVLSFGRSKYAFDVHSEKYDEHTEDAIVSQTFGYTIPLIFRTSGIIAVLVALYFSISFGENPAVLVAALVALVRIVPIASLISSSLAAVDIAIPSLDQFENLFGPAKDSQNLPLLKNYSGFTESIKLTNIFYEHSPTRGALLDINISIKKNSHIAFMGESGSGKTTCIDIIIGLLYPSSGTVFVDEELLSKIELNSFLSHVGYVQQTPFLFKGTIRDNLLWSNFNATELEMWDALDLANAGDFVRLAESTLDTEVGDKGSSFSGGQKQRIALAMALVRKPDILVLDEVTSSLDYESEKAIVDTLNKIKNKMTIISITHKISVAQNADLVYLFNNGRVIESGHISELSESAKLIYE